MIPASNFNGSGPVTDSLLGDPIDPSADLAAFDLMPDWLREIMRHAPYELHAPAMLELYRQARAAEGRDSALLRWHFRGLLKPIPEVVAEAWGPLHPEARP